MATISNLKDRPPEKRRKRQNKYNTCKTIVDGIKFDSRAEARYYKFLKNAQLAGDIQYFLRQVPFDLPGNTKYRADFMICFPDEHVEYHDVKGVVTPMFRLKKKQVEALYPVIVEIIPSNQVQ